MEWRKKLAVTLDIYCWGQACHVMVIREVGRSCVGEDLASDECPEGNLGESSVKGVGVRVNAAR